MVPPKTYVFNGFCGICTFPTQVWTCLSEVWQVHLSGFKIQDPRCPGGLGILDLGSVDLGSGSKKSFLEILDPNIKPVLRFSSLSACQT